MSINFKKRERRVNKRHNRLEPINRSSRNESKIMERKVKSVEYRPNPVNLPAVRMIGVPSIKSKLSETRRFHAGDLCNPVQRRLAQTESFTCAYKKRLEKATVSRNGDSDERIQEATKILQGPFPTQPVLLDRSADFRSEATWRVQLRPSV